MEEIKDASGKVLRVPWTWDTTSLGYNPNAVSGTVDFWGVFWDPANKGKVAIFDDHTTAIMIGAVNVGEDPYAPDLDKVKTALTELKENCKLFWSSYDSFAKPYAAGEVTMGSVWSGAATEKALRLASAVSAIAITRPGAADSIPHRNEVREAMARGALGMLKEQRGVG